MRRIIPFGLAMLLSLPTVIGAYDGVEASVAEARLGLDTADRELKNEKQDPNNAVYERMHRIIYGGKGRGDVADNRPRIAVVIGGDENIVVEERVKNRIYYHLREKFPREYFAVMKGTDINTRLLQYAEDMYYGQRETAKVVTDPKNKKKVLVEKESKVDVDGMPVGVQPRGLADLKREDFVRMGRECNYDYVFVLTVSNGEGKSHGHYVSYTDHKNIWLRVRFLDMNSGDYIYRNDIAALGKAHNGILGGRVIERSVDSAMQEAMDDISVKGY